LYPDATIFYFHFSKEKSMIARLFFLTTFTMLIAAEAAFSCSHLPLENGYTGGGTLTVFKKISANESLNLRIFNPPGWSKTDKRPVIVTVFGGAWQFCCVEQFEPYWKYFTAQGFVCVAPDYRLGQYMEERSIPDVKSAFRWVRSHADSLGIDPNRIIGMGTSAGGHLSACTGTINGMEDAAENKAVSSRPNLLALFYPVLIFDNGSSGAVYRGLTRDPVAVAPAYHLTDSTPPTLLMWGDRDDYRDGDSVFMLKAASTKMVAVKKVFKNAGHDFAIWGDGVDSGKVWCTNFFKSQGFWPNTTGVVAQKQPGPVFVSSFNNRTQIFTLSGKRVQVRGMGTNGTILHRGIYIVQSPASEGGSLQKLFVK
jgi:acetyl esterase/lipase